MAQTEPHHHDAGRILQIDVERALDLFYSTKTYQQLATPKYGLQLMSDPYILENVLDELKES